MVIKKQRGARCHDGYVDLADDGTIVFIGRVHPDNRIPIRRLLLERRLAPPCSGGGGGGGGGGPCEAIVRVRHGGGWWLTKQLLRLVVKGPTSSSVNNR